MAQLHSTSLEYGDHILSAFIVLRRPLTLNDIVTFVAIKAQRSQNEVRSDVSDTLSLACVHNFVRRVNGNYVLGEGLDSELDEVLQSHRK